MNRWIIGLWFALTASVVWAQQSSYINSNLPSGQALTVAQLRSVLINSNEQIASIAAYGGVADCSTDNTIAIQATINALNGNGGIVYLPPTAGGCYQISSTITVPEAVHIMGAGNRATYVRFNDSSGTADLFSVGHNTAQFSDINIQRKQAGTGGSLIHLTNSFWVYIHDIIVADSNVFNFVNADCGVNTSFIYHNIIKSIANDAIYMGCTSGTATSDLIVHHNQFSGGGKAGLELHDLINGSFFDNNLIFGNKYGFLGNANGAATHCCIKIRANDLDVNTTASIQYTGLNESQITENWLASAVSCTDCTNIQATSNHHVGSAAVTLKGTNYWIDVGTVWDQGITAPYTIQDDASSNHSTYVQVSGAVWPATSGTFATCTNTSHTLVANVLTGATASSGC